MQELRLVAVSEDGSYVILTQPGRGTRFSLPNDERLRAVARGQFSRLAQYEIEVESPLRPKEIQARIRAGETAEQIADTAGLPVDRVRWFEGPVIAERAYIAQQAQTASVRRPGDSGPGPRLGEIVAERLRVAGDDPEDAEWDSVKRADGSWLVQLAPSQGHGLASWVFDMKRRHAIPDDDEAARLSLPEDALAEAGLDEPEPPAQRSGTVTPFVPRSAPPSEASPDLEANQGRRPAPGTRAAGGAPRGALPPRSPAAMTRPHSARSDLPRSPEPGADPPGPAAGDPAGDRRTAAAARRTGASDPDRRTTGPGGEAARPGSGAAPAARAAGTADEATAADDRQPDEAAAAQGQGHQATSSGRGGRRGRIRRSSVPTWDEIMFGDSRRQD